MKSKPTRKKSVRRAKKAARPKAQMRKRASVRKKRAVPRAAARKPVLTRTAAAGYSGAHGILEAETESVEHLHTDIGGESGD